MKLRITVFLILVFASLHCGRSVFYANVSYMRMAGYEAGTERLPFQARVLMLPVMRWAHGNARLNGIAYRSNHQENTGPEPQTPERLLSSLIAAACVVVLGAMATLEGRRTGVSPWWLPWALVLEMLFVGYAARSTNQNYWYPYDFPEFVLFGAGCVFVRRGYWWPLLLLMPITAANRETAIFLALLWVAAEWKERQWWNTGVQAVALVVAWGAVRYAIWRVYGHNPTEVFPRLHMNLHGLSTPTAWPQIFSAFGFLWPLMWVYRKQLSGRDLRIFYASVVCVAVILWYGLWNETRIFGEFTLLAALLMGEMWSGVHGRARGVASGAGSGLADAGDTGLAEA